VILCAAGLQTQKTLWSSIRQRSVTGKGQGAGKQAGNVPPGAAMM